MTLYTCLRCDSKSVAPILELCTLAKIKMFDMCYELGQTRVSVQNSEPMVLHNAYQ